jgi:hypothetical protein
MMIWEDIRCEWRGEQIAVVRYQESDWRRGFGCAAFVFGVVVTVGGKPKSTVKSDCATCPGLLDGLGSELE